MTKRDMSLDVTKAVAMFLVVFIHVRAYAPVPDVFRTPAWLENFCTLSALPLFLMISGLFSRRLFSELSVRRLWPRLVAYLWPVMTMLGVVGIAARILMGASLVPPCGLVSYLLSSGWFFFCLALCEMVTFVAHFLARSKVWLRVLSLIFAYLAIWALPVGLFHAVEMLPFFWFGVYALPRLRESRAGDVAGLAALAVFLTACCVTGDFRQVGLNFHLTSMRLTAFSVKGFLLMGGRIALGLFGGFGLLTLVRVAVARLPVLGRLAGFGMQTMGVFFVHLLLLVVYYNCGGRYGGGTAGRLAMALVAFFLSHYIVVLTRCGRIADAVLWNPLSFLKGRKER